MGHFFFAKIDFDRLLMSSFSAIILNNNNGAC